MRDYDYFLWLLERIGFSRKGYTKLMSCLYDVPFEYVLERDMNRIDDAIALRYEYGDGMITDDVSVLEILVALSLRIDGEYIGDPAEPNPDDIFWEMCCNLGLEMYTDRTFNRDMVENCLYHWMSREFDYDGEGSIFPLNYPIQDQRRIEIWSQMQEYLSENYS